MKIWKRGVALLLALSLAALTACGQKATAPAGETAMGRYIEERWELPIEAVNISVLVRRPDGRLFAIMNDKGPNGDGENVAMQAYSTLNGKDWEKESPQWLQDLNEKQGFISDLTYGKNGECFMIYSRLEGENYLYHIARVAQDGSLQDIEGEWDKANSDSDTTIYSVVPSAEQESSKNSEAGGESAESTPAIIDAESIETESTESAGSSDAPQIDWSTYFYPSTLQVGDDGDLYVGQQFHETLRVGTDGKLKGKIGGSNYPAFTYYNSQLAIIDYGSMYGGSDSFTLYNTETGEVVQELDSKILLGADNNLIAIGQDGALYMVNANGIYRLVVDGTTWERIVDGNLCSLSMPSMRLSRFIPHGENEFLTIVDEQEKPVLINYVYSATTPTRPTTELTVATLKKNDTLLQAAGEFRRNHPEVLVTVQTLLEEDGAATSADAIRALNTQLLAGKGPDLLLLDGLPLDSYIEKDVLADLSDWAIP